VRSDGFTNADYQSHAPDWTTNGYKLEQNSAQFSTKIDQKDFDRDTEFCLNANHADGGDIE
jgi:hypothetical protein|tara:strand:- start:781 stop:963 length:183 start_codon:yes stop_codon:yes gene_type:complete